MFNPVSALFEQELARRGVSYRVDGASQRYWIGHQGREFLVSLDNLARAYSRIPTGRRSLISSTGYSASASRIGPGRRCSRASFSH